VSATAELLVLIGKMFKDVFRWPSSAESLIVADEYQSRNGIRGVIGCIAGSHIHTCTNGKKLSPLHLVVNCMPES